jgi:transposase-like protein
VANARGAKHRGLEFWQAAVERLKAGENLAEVAAELGVDRRGLFRWRERLDPEAETAGQRREKALSKEVDRLKKALAEKVLVVDFLQGALHKVEARRRQSESGGEPGSTTRSEK